MCKRSPSPAQKGGVAKTVTCHHLAYALMEQGRRVLTVDLDPQINLTATLSTNEETTPEFSISDLIFLLLKDESLPAASSFIASHGRGSTFIYGSKDPVAAGGACCRQKWVPNIFWNPSCRLYGQPMTILS